MLAPTAVATVRFDRISKRFGDRIILDGISAVVSPGTSLSLLGPNGSGKTTVMRIACGILAADAGSVIVEPVARPAFAYAPPGDRALYQRLTARQNLEFFAAAAGASPRDAQASAGDALALLDATHLSDRVVASCSTGERRRIALARAFATRAACMLIDEPYSDLDDDGRAALSNAAALWTRSGGSIVFAMPLRDSGPASDEVLEL